MAEKAFYSTGRRKTAVARVWMTPGSGAVTINRRDVDNYFGRATSKMVLRQPLEATETIGRYDVIAVFEAADDESATALAFSASSLGSVRSEILRAFSFEEMSRILGKMV